MKKKAAKEIPAAVLEHQRCLAAGLPLLPSIPAELAPAALYAAALVPSRLWPELERGPFFQLLLLIFTPAETVLRLPDVPVPANRYDLHRILNHLRPHEVEGMDQRCYRYHPASPIQWDSERRLWLLTQGQFTTPPATLRRLLLERLEMAFPDKDGPDRNLSGHRFRKGSLFTPLIELPSKLKAAAAALRLRKYGTPVAFELDGDGRLVRIHSADPFDYVTIGPWDPESRDLLASMRPYKEKLKPGSEYEPRTRLFSARHRRRLSSIPVSLPPLEHQ